MFSRGVGLLARRAVSFRAVAVAAGAVAGGGALFVMSQDQAGAPVSAASFLRLRGNLLVAQAKDSSRDWQIWFETGEYNLLEKSLRQALSEGRNAEVLWQLARVVHKQREALGAAADKTVAPNMAREAHALAEESVRLNPKSAQAMKWLGITLSALGQFEGAKVKIGNAFKIRDLWEEAARLNPKDATTKYLLGVWCFNITNISWLERNAAAVLFATPPKSTYEEALRYFLDAEETEPGFYLENSLKIAETYEALKLPNEARQWAERVVAATARDNEERESQAKARELLKRVPAKK